jgi:hypothetical protein
MLATDPYVRVNGGLPKRLTKAPIHFELPAGKVDVEVTLFKSGHTSVEGRWSNPISRYAGEVGDDDRLRLWFHPALFNSYMRRGHLRRE